MNLRASGALIALLLASNSFAASPTTDEKLQATRVQHFVAMSLKDDSFRFIVDSFVQTNRRTLDSLELFLISGEANLYLMNFNPLAMTVSTTQAVNDLETSEQLKAFQAALSGFQSTLGFTIPSTKSSESESKPIAEPLGTEPPAGSSPGAASAPTGSLEFLKDTAPSDSDCVIEWADILNLFEKSKAFVDRKVSIDQGALKRWAEAQGFAQIYEESDSVLNQMNKELAVVRSIATDGSSISKDIAGLVAKVGKETRAEIAKLEEAEIVDDSEVRARKAAVSRCRQDLSLALLTLDFALIRVNARVAAANELAETLQKLVSRVEKHNDKGDWDSSENGSNHAYAIDRVRVGPEQFVDVSVAVARTTMKIGESGKLEVKDEKKREIKIRFTELRTVIVEPAIGVVYSDIRIPKFGTSTVNDELMVTADAPEQKRLHETVMLNFIFKPLGVTNRVHGLLQLGLTSGPDYPGVLLGSGVRITSPIRLLVTGGILVTWRKVLRNLNVGNVIQELDDLEEDLDLRAARREWYLGILTAF